MITSTGRVGLFRWNSADRSAEYANDPQMGIHIPLNGNNGSGGAFIRILDTEITPQMFGANGDGTGDDSGDKRFLCGKSERATTRSRSCQ
ncbi:hypothetical protein FE784_29445 [Paenibacillus hemerocallicola]|uniref:Uncharacterized protein n=1 Tax=Paenibacillus hemerocallicola TaxID=1172614 RepID=A0A5C4T1H4_9BACL|nr:hypothetical protein [Paenibacillus hemerocallicola]TNJ62655.1 hypothetical protein FE784_29445 [Paenibacillus hemerocallicola]